MVRRGRRFESVRGLCKSHANRGFSCRSNLHELQHAVGMEPFMEPSDSDAASGPTPWRRRRKVITSRSVGDPMAPQEARRAQGDVWLAARLENSWKIGRAH